MPEIKEKESLYRGKLIELERLKIQDDGEMQEREVVRHRPSVAIVVLLDRNEEGVKGLEVLFVRQFRAPLGQELTELVAGLVDEGESPLDAARRELREETGLVAEVWTELGTIYASPGFTDEAITLFLARQVRSVGADPDAGEKIGLHMVPFTLALQQIREQEIQDAKTVAALLWTSVLLAQEARA